VSSDDGGRIIFVPLHALSHPTTAIYPPAIRQAEPDHTCGPARILLVNGSSRTESKTSRLVEIAKAAIETGFPGAGTRVAPAIPTAALSGSHIKAPGSAGGYLAIPGLLSWRHIQKTIATRQRRSCGSRRFPMIGFQRVPAPVVAGALSAIHVMALRSYFKPGAAFIASFVVFITIYHLLLFLVVK